MLNILLKILIIFRVYSRLIKSTNITLKLRYRHNNLESLKSLTESLESYFELLILFKFKVFLNLDLLLLFIYLIFRILLLFIFFVVTKNFV
jgi:hypothetical protein